MEVGESDFRDASLGRSLPIKNEIITEGSMGRISRLYFQDGSTRIAKNALKPDFNRYLVNEYTFMLTLYDSKLAPAIPRVFDEFPAKNPKVDTYGFTMEDLYEFKALLDLPTQTALVDSLDVDERMLILSDICKTLQYVNSEGVVYNDVALQNIMTNGEKTKLIDWGNAEYLNEENKFSDVKQTAQLIPKMFGALMPPSLEKWQALVNDNKYKDPSDAWLALREFWNVAF